MGRSDTDIWGRVIEAGWKGLDARTARAVLKLNFQAGDARRIARLVKLAGDDRLSDDQRAELDGYLHVGRVLTMMHSRARRFLDRETATRRRKAS